MTVGVDSLCKEIGTREIVYECGGCDAGEQNWPDGAQTQHVGDSERTGVCKNEMESCWV